MDRRVYTVKGSRRFYIMLHSTDSVPVPVHSSCYSSGLRAFQHFKEPSNAHKTVIETSDVVCIEKDRLFAH